MARVMFKRGFDFVMGFNFVIGFNFSLYFGDICIKITSSVLIRRPIGGRINLCYIGKRSFA